MSHHHEYDLSPHTRLKPEEFDGLREMSVDLLADVGDDFTRTETMATGMLDMLAPINNQELTALRYYSLGEQGRGFLKRLKRQEVYDGVVASLVETYTAKSLVDKEGSVQLLGLDDVRDYARGDIPGITALSRAGYNDMSPGERLLADGLQYAHDYRVAEKIGALPAEQQPKDFTVESAKAKALTEFVAGGKPVQTFASEAMTPAQLLRIALRRRHGFLKNGHGEYPEGPVITDRLPVADILALGDIDPLDLDTITKRLTPVRTDTFVKGIGRAVEVDQAGRCAVDPGVLRALLENQPDQPEGLLGANILHEKAVVCVAQYLRGLIPLMNGVFVEAMKDADARIRERLGEAALTTNGERIVQYYRERLERTQPHWWI